jgi:hypothetical protein
MTRSATEVMQDVLLSAVLDGIDALKAASKGMPNTLLRDLNAIHANAAYADLPKELQQAIAASVRTAFNRLLREGYSVAPAGSSPPPRAQPHQPHGAHSPGHRPRGPHRPSGPGGARPQRKPGPGGGGRPPGKPGGGGPRRGG